MLYRLPFATFLLFAGVLFAGEEKLIPAQFNARNDSGNSSWDIRSNGEVGDGSNDCFDTGLALTLNSQPFQARQQQQTADGKELVLSGVVGGLAVTRRVLLDVQRQGVRYLELVTNSSNQEQKVTLVVTSSLGGQAMSAIWNDGTPAASGPLAKKCVALSAIQQPRGNRPGVIWIIGESQAASPPTVNIQNQHAFSFSYSFTLKPKQVRVVFHYVLQRPALLAAQVNDSVKAFWKNHLIKPIVPTALKQLLVNFRVGGTAESGEEADDVSPRLPPIAALLERAGVEDTAGKTVVGVGRSEAERMTGSLSGGPLIAATEFGPVTIAQAELAGSEGSGFRALLHLRSGETIAANSLSGALRLETEAGVDLPIDPTQVAWMVTKRDAQDGIAPVDQLGVLILTDGSRLAVSAATPALPLISSFGQAAVAFDQLLSLQRVTEPPGWLATMRDGSCLRVLPNVKALDVVTCRHGARQIVTARIAGYLRSGKIPAFDEDRADGAHLESGERFLGGLAGTTLTLQANGVDTAIPVERITAIERPEDSNGLAIVLRDGGRLVGSSSEGTVAFLAGGQTWRVPIRRLLQWQAPIPTKPSATDENGKKSSDGDVDKKAKAKEGTDKQATEAESKEIPSGEKKP